MIAPPRLLRVRPIDFLSAERLNLRDRLQDRHAVGTASPEVVYLTGPGVAGKLLERAYYIKTMNIGEDLFSIVTVNRISLARTSDIHQRKQKPVPFVSRVRRFGQTSAAQDAPALSKIPAVLLRIYVGFNFGSSKKV